MIARRIFMARQARPGEMGFGVARRGEAGVAGRDRVRWGVARRGKAGEARLGVAGTGRVRLGMVWQAWSGKTW